MIAVDMAAVGKGQTSDAFATTVCVKDASGPFERMHRTSAEETARLLLAYLLAA